MSDVPGDLKYTKSHEWVREEEDGSVLVGITDHAQSALGDLVFVEPPEEGSEVAAGDACAVVESVKAASDVYSPVTGEVTEAKDFIHAFSFGDRTRSFLKVPWNAVWPVRKSLRPCRARR